MGDTQAWEMARAVPHARLAGHVLDYCGYREDVPGPLRRREVPSSRITLILSFSAPIRVALGGPPATFTSFVAGLHDGPAFTEHDGGQHGVEVGLTPRGARSLLGVPPAELANAVVHLDDVLGPLASQLVERLATANGWAERFAVLDTAFATRADRGPPPAAAVAHVWRRLADSAGGVAIRELGEEVGWSRRHLATRFREQVGLTPKVMARVLRFERAHGLLTAPGRPPLAELAAVCGYADQAHLNREFRALAGCTPTELLLDTPWSPSSKTAADRRA